MENKNIITAVVCLVAGLLIGFLVWGGSNQNRMMNNQGGHMMPNGMMMNGSMDMQSMMADMNANLAGKNGDDFDKAFIDEMVIHHQGAIDIAELALTNAKHQEIKGLANEIIKAQTSEINQMKQWRASWFK
jgi:uncharacterized protein (DUF305 family)